jgi:hypothetical protein
MPCAPGLRISVVPLTLAGAEARFLKPKLDHQHADHDAASCTNLCGFQIRSASCW